MASLFPIGQNDREPAIVAVLRDGTGAVIDLSPAGVSGVQFLMRAVAGPVKVDAAAEVFGTPTEGRARYLWAAGDTDTPGDYDCYWLITTTDGKTLSVPNATYDRVFVREAFGP